MKETAMESKESPLTSFDKDLIKNILGQLAVEGAHDLERQAELLIHVFRLVNNS